MSRPSPALHRSLTPTGTLNIMPNDMMNEAGSPSDFHTLAALIKDIRVAMMQTYPAGGGPCAFPPHVRPMYTQQLEPDVFEGELWFFSDTDSLKVLDLERNPRILLTYAAPALNRFVVVAGSGRCERDAAKEEELWNIHGKGWWPDGPRSPDLMLIRVQVESAEYWEGPSGASYMLRLLKAVVTGERVKPMGEHGVVR